MGDKAIVRVVLDNKTFYVPLTYGQTSAEDVVIFVSKELGIGAVARHIFALRDAKGNYLMPAELITPVCVNYDLRVRYKVPNILGLKRIDGRAYEYYFHQVRLDVIESKILDIPFESNRPQLLGLGVTDMYRIMLEKGTSQEVILNEYKKYIPKEVLNRHSIFVKKPIKDALSKLCRQPRSNHSASFVIDAYLREFETMAMEYPLEEYKAQLDQEGDLHRILLRASPFHPSIPGIRYCFENEKTEKVPIWKQICAIEDICSISIRNDFSIEINRSDASPFYIKFCSLAKMRSFVSLIDGYYRLSVKWITNICKDVLTPSLSRLNEAKFHGPVGGEFSYFKLEDKRSNYKGTYLIRESECVYNLYFVDVSMGENKKPMTYRLERTQNDEFIFQDDPHKYASLAELKLAYTDPDGAIYLRECLPPMENDNSPLLLCKSNTIGDDLESASEENLTVSNPSFINNCDLRIFTGNVLCQAWAAKNPVHVVHASYTDDTFPERSKERAKNYCRNPSRDPKGPWCYTMDSMLSDDNCGVPLCSLDVCRITGPGMEYGGMHSHAAIDMKCLKWTKNRKKVRLRGNLTRIDKYPKDKFPDDSLEESAKVCRNPDGDLAGPWCFVQVPDSSEVMKQYCDIPFCDDQDCMVFTRNESLYSHYIAFPAKETNFTFGIKLWDPDSYMDAKVHLVLSYLPLPLTGKQVEQAGIGIEIMLSNLKSALTFGNRDDPEYETTYGILKSTAYSMFVLHWDKGFVSLSRFGESKPIFLQEIKTKGTLLLGRKDNDLFRYYAPSGQNVMWSFPFCDDDNECDVHTTSRKAFHYFWPLRQTDVGHDLQFYVRAFHSACLLLTPSPVLDFPNVKICIGHSDEYSRITTCPYPNGPTTALVEKTFADIITYWRFSQFTINVFADTLSFYWVKDVGSFMIMQAKHEAIKALRWFSPSSDNTMAHWTFNCKPPRFAEAHPAFLPECALDRKESSYIGRQQVTHDGTPCLPWSADWIPESVKTKVKNLLEIENYCRDPLGEHNGTYCYVFNDKGVAEKRHCGIRKCKSAECRMAGTGNDYIGKTNTTRSNRTCQFWTSETAPNKKEGRHLRSRFFTRELDNPEIDLPHAGPVIRNMSAAVKAFVNETAEDGLRMNKLQVHQVPLELLNETLYADMAAERAENFCRNPSRSIAGSWCYTLDQSVPVDACHVPDCDRNEESVIILLGNHVGRNVYILPQWREKGIHGGIHFGLKQWNPDYFEGIKFELKSRQQKSLLELQIGADRNEKLKLLQQGKVLVEKTMPNLIPSGKWASFWLQMRQGELQLGYEGIPDTVLEWIAQDPSVEEIPVFVDFRTIGDKPIGVFSTADECHTEMTTTKHFNKYMPINIWTMDDAITFSNLTLYVRGSGTLRIQLAAVPGTSASYIIEISRTQISLWQEKVLNSKVYAEDLFANDSWSLILVTFSEMMLNVTLDDDDGENGFVYESKVPLLFYYFSVAVGAASEWVAWVANCDPLDIDGPPKDGGWSPWSSWVCTVTCGGGVGYRTRQCNHPRPNIFGQLCSGEPTSTGKCNEFECGDLSPETFDLIRARLKKKATSIVVDEGQAITIANDQEVLSSITNESPEASYEWMLNGFFIKAVDGHIEFIGDDIILKNASKGDAGVYTCILSRMNGERVVFRVVALAVRPERDSIITRATLPMDLQCRSLSLGYVYTDLWQTWTLDNSVYIDYGVTTLAAVTTEHFDKTNRSMTGVWRCIVEQKDLKLKWVTNIEKVRIKRPPNMYTHLKEDPITRPIFGKIDNDAVIVLIIVLFVVLVFGSVALFVCAYLKWGTISTRSDERRKRKIQRNRRY